MTLEELRQAIAVRLAEIGNGLPSDYMLTLVARHRTNSEAHIVVTEDPDGQAAVRALQSLLVEDAAGDSTQHEGRTVEVIAAARDAADGNLTLAANLLGMHRRSLQRYLNRRKAQR